MISPIHTGIFVAITRLILPEKLKIICHEPHTLPIKMSWKDTKLTDNSFNLISKYGYTSLSRNEPENHHYSSGFDKICQNNLNS